MATSQKVVVSGEEAATKKTGSKRNQVAGHNWERLCARKLNELGIFPVRVASTREVSRHLDSMKIDLAYKLGTEDDPNQSLPINVQCKCTSCKISYAKVLSEMPKNGSPNVIFQKITERKVAGGKFMAVGEYAILSLEDFNKLLVLAYGPVLTDQMHTFPDDDEFQQDGQSSVDRR